MSNAPYKFCKRAIKNICCILSLRLVFNFRAMRWVFQHNLYGYILKLFDIIVEFLNCSNYFNHEVLDFAFLDFK
jgi:hypothetical protein